MRRWKKHQGTEGKNIQRQRVPPSQKRETTGAVHFVEESTDMTVKKWSTRVNEEQYYASTADVLDAFVKVIWP